MHLWELAEQMARMGCEIEVATPLETEFSPFLRFGLFWKSPYRHPIEDVAIEGAPHPIRIIRFPVRNLSKIVASLYQKHLQRRWEKEELEMEVDSLRPLPSLTASPILLNGWHLPEVAGGKVLRWTMGTARIRLPETHSMMFHLKAYAPKNLRVDLEYAGQTQTIFQGQGNVNVTVPIPDHPRAVAVIHVQPTWRPLRDTRTLGIQVSQVALMDSNNHIIMAPSHVDHRTLRAQDKKNFIDTYVARAQRRPSRYSWLFDQLRGPRCPGMIRFLEENFKKYDWVIGGVLPFSNLASVMEVRRRHPFRLALLPLFHVDDDFYYWSHYLDVLRRADVCLANSWFSSKYFYPTIGAKWINAGAGVDESIFRGPDISGERFRKRFGFDASEKIVLSVGRKSGSKQYRVIIKAVDSIQEQAPCRLVLVGPDEDHQPITSPHCSYLGALSQSDLLDAYDACDVFCLMSESESFGMVFLEAWMREKPVIGNRNCGPVAILIKEGVNGLLASNRAELEENLVTLLHDSDTRKRFGQLGLEQASTNHTWNVIAKRILEHFQKAMK